MKIIIQLQREVAARSIDTTVFLQALYPFHSLFRVLVLHCYGYWIRLFCLLPWIDHLVVLSNPDLRLAFVDNVFDKYLPRVLCFIFSDPSRIP